MEQGTGSPIWLCRGFFSEASCGTEGHRFLYLIPKDFLVRVRPLVKMGSQLFKTGSPEFG